MVVALSDGSVISYRSVSFTAWLTSGKFKPGSWILFLDIYCVSLDQEILQQAAKGNYIAPAYPAIYCVRLHQEILGRPLTVIYLPLDHPSILWR